MSTGTQTKIAVQPPMPPALPPTETRKLRGLAPADAASPSPFTGDPFSPHKLLNHFDSVRALLRGEVVAPITVEIDPTNVCNHRCQWCVSSASHTGEQLRLDELQALISGLARIGSRSIVLKGGGEPTLHRQFDVLCRAIAEAGLALGLITNGSMPWPDTPRTLLETAEWVRISLDAARAKTHQAIHGSRDFKRIVRNVAYLTENARRTLVGLNFVAEQRNCAEVAEFARLGKSLGVHYVYFRWVFDPHSPLDEAVRQELLRQLSEARGLADEHFRVMVGPLQDTRSAAVLGQPFPYRRCLGPNLVGIVGADGEVYACCFLRGDKRFSFGDIHQQSFDEIWHGQRRREVMEGIYRGSCGYLCKDGGMTFSRYQVYNEILNYLELEPKAHADFV